MKSPSNQITDVQTRRRMSILVKDIVRSVCMSSTFNQVNFKCYHSLIEPKSVKEALDDEN